MDLVLAEEQDRRARRHKPHPDRKQVPTPGGKSSRRKTAMIDPSEIVTSLVAMLRDVPDLIAEMGDDAERIYAYHDQYPKNVSLVHAIHAMPAPSIMAVWQGTQPGSFGGMDVWKHQVTLFLRAKETFGGDPPT